MIEKDAELMQLIRETIERCNAQLNKMSPERTDAYEVIEEAKDTLQTVERAFRVAPNKATKNGVVITHGSRR